jgi:PadR family transcriptional regulator, regulatory protein AphA
MAAPDDRNLSTTSYSILGYLAIRPFTAYELTKQMGRTFHHFWPRAESGIYREMKRLLDHGLVAASEEAVGRRARTRYSITDAGRAAVREWLATPTAPGFLECEGLVRVLWADQGSKDDLRAAIDAMRADAARTLDLMAGVGGQYVAHTGDYQERSHVNVMIGRFLVDFSAMVTEWTAWADGFVESWADTASGPPTDATDEQWRAVLARRP